MSIWNPIEALFRRSISSNHSAGRKTDRRKNRNFAARIERLEGRALLTTVTGDFNGDRVADLAIGVPTQAVGGATNAGSVQIIYGTPLNGIATGLSVAKNQTLNRPSFTGAPAAGDKFGTALAVGDFNRDGLADLVVSAPGQGGGGAVYVFFGSRQGLKTTGVQMITQSVLGRAGNVGSNFGASLAVGDFNLDHFADLAIGTPNRTVNGLANAGVVNVVYGRPLGLRAINNQQWDQSQLNSAAPLASGNLFGTALAVGDFNADGLKDLAVGSPGQGGSTGAVNVIYGRLAGLKALNNQVWKVGTGGIAGTSNANAQFGFSLAAGDFNADSRMDLAIGAPGEDIPANGNSQAAVSGAGAVHVLFGSAARLTAANNQLWNESTTGLTNALAAGDDDFGASLAAGRLNGDRFDDLAIGVPGGTTPQDTSNNNPVTPTAGTVRVLYSAGNAGLGTANTQLWHQNIAGMVGGASDGQGAMTGEKFGATVAIGDMNGDRLPDLAVEVPAETLNNSTAGSAHILYAASNGLNVGGGGLEVNQEWIPNSVHNPEAFLATNKTKPGVVTLTDGLQYKVIKLGSGGVGTVDSQYTVNYIGMHADGTVFDSSAQHGGPATFGLNGLIPGFSEALSLMRVGDHWTVYLPSNLAYGAGGNPNANINPNEVLIFDLEIVSIN